MKQGISWKEVNKLNNDMLEAFSRGAQEACKLVDQGKKKTGVPCLFTARAVNMDRSSGDLAASSLKLILKPHFLDPLHSLSIPFIPLHPSPSKLDQEHQGRSRRLERRLGSLILRRGTVTGLVSQ